MSLRAPGTTAVGKTVRDGNELWYVYIETDYEITNLRPSFQKLFQSKTVWYRYEGNSTDINTFARELTNTNYLRFENTSGTYVYISIGRTDSVSTFCGQYDSFDAVTKVLSYVDTSKADINASDVTTLKNAKASFSAAGPSNSQSPVLRTRGQVSMVLNRVVSNASKSGNLAGASVTVGQQAAATAADYTFNANELIMRWTAYITAGQTTATMLRFHDGTGTQKTSKEITTIGDFLTTFSTYIAYDERLKGAALEQLFKKDARLTYFDNKVYPLGYVDLWKSFVDQGLNEDKIIEALIQQGFSSTQARDARTLYTSKTNATMYDQAYGNRGGSSGSSGGSSGGSPGGATTPNNKTWYGPEGYAPGQISNLTIQRSRNVFLDADTQSRIYNATGAEKIMYQVYMGDPQGTGTIRPVRDEFIFHIAPNEINYSGFGNEWTQIDRVGSFPYIDWKSFKLLQISFSFLVVAKPDKKSSTADGIDIPVTEEILRLQRMSQAPYPVMFYGFDRLLTQQFRYDTTEGQKARGIQFVIQDLQITALRRNEKMEITRAQANITLQEIPVESTAIIGMPRLNHKSVPPVPPPRTPPEEKYLLPTDTLTTGATGTYSYAPFQPAT